jgi:beta-glucan synthesis-associated protein KRE6
VITLSEVSNHNLNFQSGEFSWQPILDSTLISNFPGMLTSWNKFCLTTGYIEVSVSLPGSVRAPGLWPGAYETVVVCEQE